MILLNYSTSTFYVDRAKEYKDQLQHYKDYEEKAIVQNYQDALKRYEDNQGDIKTLKEEIVTLYQFLNNYIFYEN